VWRGKGTALELLWEVAEEGGTRQLGVPQSLEDDPGHSWLPWEEDLPLGQVIH